jgi:methyl-accepting chemotaxis protein
LAEIKSEIVDKISAAIIVVDRDLVITYVNEPTRALLKKYEVALQSIWPSFEAEKIVGMCIDTFHKNPSHQRQLLADPTRFPIRTEIALGDLKISMLVNGAFDANNNLVGNILEWGDVTTQRLNAGMLDAIGRAQAVIEFSMDGKVRYANENFLKMMGYTLEEIEGQHHSFFVEAAFRQSPEYRLLWEKLARGEFDAGQYKQIGKGGREIWIQASYNPILDANSKPFRVVQYASDITASVKASEALQQAVQQVQDAVIAAKKNDLTQRVPLEGKAGDIHALCSGVNGLLDANAASAEASRLLQRSVQEVQEVVAAAKDNDLTHRVPLDGKVGDVAVLCSGINGLLDAIASVIVKVRNSTREVSSASAEISASATDLSQRTEEQAASLEETSSAMEEMAATVKKNAENAQEANQSAAGTRDVANRGGEVVAKAVGAMARIEESSRKISDIIGVIDEIARQTNLLALNAAVEAARAGDAGRGFAVVASEVRSLAQRSSQAAKDIKDLITNSNSQVKDGVELVNKAGTALNEIVESTKKVADIVSDIAAASAEQATGIEQVNKALVQMDEVTQQNSALVEENAATAKTLEQQSKAMDDELSMFRVDDSAFDAPASAQYRAAAVTAKPAIAKPVETKGATVAPRVPPPAAKSAPLKRAAAGANGKAAGGPVGRMQAALATAVNEEWKEF